MKSFNDFATEKVLREFRAYLESEARKHPQAFEMFVHAHPKLEEASLQELSNWLPWNWGRGQQQQQPQAPAQDDSNLPIAAGNGQPAVYPGQNDPNMPIAAGQGQPAVYPNQNNPNLPIAAGGGKPAVYPNKNDPNMPIAAGGGKPAVYPGENNPNVPFGQEMPDNNASKTVSTAIKAFTDNIMKKAQKVSPNNVQQIQQAVKNFGDQWVAFKQQVIPLLGFQGVKNPEKHGLTYPLAPGQ